MICDFIFFGHWVIPVFYVNCIRDSLFKQENMRKFYEAWSELKDKSASTLADLQNTDVEDIEELKKLL